MKLLRLNSGRKLSLYGAMVTTMGYAAMVLASGPAFAAECPCEALRIYADYECSLESGGPYYGGVILFECDDTSYYFECLNGPTGIGSTC